MRKRCQLIKRLRSVPSSCPQNQSSHKVFDGSLTKYLFQSKTLGNLDANFNLFLPPQAYEIKKVPILYFLAGLTCTEDNAAQKGGFFEAAAKEGIAICFPDTSPRGAKIEGEDDSYDFGSGAGFYVNASKEPWSKHYKVCCHDDLVLAKGQSLTADLRIFNSSDVRPCLGGDS